jgi:DNA-binding MarR family transcriptional regulator
LELTIAMKPADNAGILLSVIDEVLRLRRSFEVLFADVRGASHLTTLQKLVLSAIFDSRVLPTVPQIGRNLGYPRQLIQRVVNELVDDGLIETAPNPHHKRASLLEPTEKAHAIKRQAEILASRTSDAFLRTFGRNRCRGLIGELQTLRRAIMEYTQAGKLTSAAPPGPSTSNILALL